MCRRCFFAENVSVFNRFRRWQSDRQRIHLFHLEIEFHAFEDFHPSPFCSEPLNRKEKWNKTFVIRFEKSIFCCPRRQCDARVTIVWRWCDDLAVHRGFDFRWHIRSQAHSKIWRNCSPFFFWASNCLSVLSVHPIPHMLMISPEYKKLSYKNIIAATL